MYELRRACRSDLPLLASWRAEPHVRRWWGDPKVEPPHETLAEPRVRLWIAEHAGDPFALIQDYRVADWPPHHFDILPPGAHGLDMFIGPPGMLGRGHGPRILDRHAEALFAAGVPAVGIDPHPDNALAIAAFRKAGFAPIGTPLQTRWNHALPMARFADGGTPDLASAEPR